MQLKDTAFSKIQAAQAASINLVELKVLVQTIQLSKNMRGVILKI